MYKLLGVYTQELFVMVVHYPSRFGSFEIFKRADEHTGRQGPSYGRDEIRGQMLDYVIEMFYPEIQQNFPDRVERNVAFFREVRAPDWHFLSQPSTSTFQSMVYKFYIIHSDQHLIDSRPDIKV